MTRGVKAPEFKMSRGGLGVAGGVTSSAERGGERLKTSLCLGLNHAGRNRQVETEEGPCAGGAWSKAHPSRKQQGRGHWGGTVHTSQCRTGFGSTSERVFGGRRHQPTRTRSGAAAPRRAKPTLHGVWLRQGNVVSTGPAKECSVYKTMAF